MGCARDVAEAALAHAVSDKTEAAYLRTDHLDARRPLMQAWGIIVLAVPVPHQLNASLRSKRCDQIEEINFEIAILTATYRVGARSRGCLKRRACRAGIC